MKKLKLITSIILSAAIALSSSAVFSAAAKAPTLKAVNKKASIKLSWSKVKGAKSYTLMYKKGSASYKKAYSGKKTSFSFKKPKASTTYTFKVKAKGGKYSKAQKITFLKAPSFLADETVDMDGIRIAISKVKGATSYKIYRSIRYKNSFKKIATVKSTAKPLAYMDKNVKSIQSYTYYVVASNGKSKSAKSELKNEIYGYYDKKTDAPLTLTIKKGKYKDIYEKLDKYYATGLVSWKSLNKNIVKVSSKGVFTGVKKGTATVLATVQKGVYKNNKKKTIKINVTVK